MMEKSDDAAPTASPIPASANPHAYPKPPVNQAAAAPAPAPQPGTAATETATASQPAKTTATTRTTHPAERGLSSMQHVVDLADNLSHSANQLHDRIMHEIRSYDGRPVPQAAQATMRQLFDDEALLRQRANTLYADAAAFVIQGLNLPQSRLMLLTTAAAEKIRRIGVIGEVTGLVGGLLSLAGAVAAVQPTPIALALEKIQYHADVLDTLTPPPATA